MKEQLTHDILHSDGIRDQYDDKLLQELQQLRAQNDQEIVALREEIALQYEKKVMIEKSPLFSDLKTIVLDR